MKKEILEDALLSSLTLLNNEIESVVIDDLKEEYLSVIEKVESALKELNGNG
jgi:hypothetical protein